MASELAGERVVALRAMDRRTRNARYAFAVALFLGCFDRGKGVDSPPSAPLSAFADRAADGRGIDDPVVLFTIDGVRWSEIFEGTDPSRGLPTAPASAITPNLHRIVRERGAFVGAPNRGVIASTGPNYLSLPGYAEIFGGRPSACQANTCAPTTLPTIFDEAHSAGARVAVFASWGGLASVATANPGAFLVDCGRGSEPLDPAPGHDDYRPDRVTAEAALTYFAAEQPDVFYLGLGDADEYAHHGHYSAYVASIHYADDVLGRIVEILDRSGDRGRRTHVIVTTDHGRANNFANHGRMPEAARVWMAAFGPRFGARGEPRSAHERRLADIAPTMRRVLGLPSDASAHAGEPIDELFGESRERYALTSPTGQETPVPPSPQ